MESTIGTVLAVYALMALACAGCMLNGALEGDPVGLGMIAAAVLGVPLVVGMYEVLTWSMCTHTAHVRVDINHRSSRTEACVRM